MPTPPALIHLRASGCSLLIDLTDGRLPSVIHWGADLGELGAAGAAAARLMTRAGTRPYTSPDTGVTSVLAQGDLGWMGRPGLKGSRAGRSWATAFTVTAVDVVGHRKDDVVEAGAVLAVIDARDEEAALSLRLEIEMLPSGLVRQRARLRNDGAAYALEEMLLGLPVPARATRLLDFTGRWGMERIPQSAEFTAGMHLRENRRGTTGADSAYLLHAMEPGTDFATGEVWGVHTAWSGNHIHFAERANTGTRVIGGGELLLPGEVLLDEGGSYRTPWIYGSYGVGLDSVAHRFHRYLRDRPHHVGPDRPVIFNVWEAVTFDHDEQRLLELVTVAADVGVERFVLDDGWFGARRVSSAGLGDWTVSPDAWPRGLHPLIDAVKAKGMQFGLWVEPEMVNLDSDLARAHPEWVMAARQELPVPQRKQYVLDLTNPDCYRAIRDQLLALLDQYAIDYLKWDHNRDHPEAGSPVRGGSPAVHGRTVATYRMIDELRAAHPRLEIESCAAGGGRIDLEILERTDRVWVSDCIDPLERQRLMRWTAQLLPPELMGAHVASPRSHTTGRSHDLSFRGAAALFGHYGVEWDLASAGPAERAELASWIAAYKTHRRLINTGSLVRGPDPSPDLWVTGVVAPDADEALYVISSLAWSQSHPLPRVRLRGLDPDRAYRVTPVSPSGPPSGFVETEWWAAGDTLFAGALLARVGLQCPSTHPEQSIVLHVTSGEADPGRR